MTDLFEILRQHGVKNPKRQLIKYLETELELDSSGEVPRKLDDLADVETNGAQNGDFLQFSSGKWRPS
jgi:hypothetical protein